MLKTSIIVCFCCNLYYCFGQVSSQTISVPCIIHIFNEVVSFCVMNMGHRLQLKAMLENANGDIIDGLQRTTSMEQLSFQTWTDHHS